jgi:hypothetical protein
MFHLKQSLSTNNSTLVFQITLIKNVHGFWNFLFKLGEKRNRKRRGRRLSYQKGTFSRGRKFGIVFITHRLRVTAGSEENIKMREGKKLTIKGIQSRETFSRKKRWSGTEC